MKLRFLLVLAILSSAIVYGQNGIKVYGYVQENLPGTIHVEEGVGSDKSKDRSEYFIYLSSKSTIQPVEMWIHGKAYSLSTEKINSTPVKLATGSKNTTIVVAKTSNKLWKLSPIPYTPGKNFSKAKEKAKSNDLVVVYKLNGSFYSAVLKTITRLEPVLNE